MTSTSTLHDLERYPTGQHKNHYKEILNSRIKFKYSFFNNNVKKIPPLYDNFNYFLLVHSQLVGYNLT